MKKKISIIMLALCLILVCTVPRTDASAAGGLCFIACDDTLLTLDSMPYFSNQTYVPYWVFSNFGIYFSLFESSGTAMAFTSSKQVYFSTSSDVASDSNDEFYYAPLVLRGGTSYLPLDFMCSYFGLAWSYISGTGYGDIVRIKSSAVTLTDSQFLSAASSLMEERYNAYYGISDATPAPTKAPASPAPLSREDVTVYLSFTGIPTDELLSELAEYDVQACFFLTADDISSYPDIVRGLFCSGHNVGLLCSSLDDVKTASEILFKTAHRLSILVAGDIAREDAEENGLVYCGSTLSDIAEDGSRVSDSAITSSIGKADEIVVLRMECCDETADALPRILNYLKTGKYTIGIINESFLSPQS